MKKKSYCSQTKWILSFSVCAERRCSLVCVFHLKSASFEKQISCWMLKFHIHPHFGFHNFPFPICPIWWNKISLSQWKGNEPFPQLLEHIWTPHSIDIMKNDSLEVFTFLPFVSYSFKTLKPVVMRGYLLYQRRKAPSVYTFLFFLLIWALIVFDRLVICLGFFFNYNSFSDILLLHCTFLHVGAQKTLLIFS